MLQMKLKSFSFSLCLSTILFFSPLLSEEKIDIWNNKKENNQESSSNSSTTKTQKNNKTLSSETIKSLEKIEIQEGTEIKSKEQKVYGI